MGEVKTEIQGQTDIIDRWQYIDRQQNKKKTKQTDRQTYRDTDTRRCEKHNNKQEILTDIQRYNGTAQLEDEKRDRKTKQTG